MEVAPPAAHPLSRHVPTRHVPPGTPDDYKALVARLRAWTPLPVSEIVATLERTLESTAPPCDQELVYIHWQLRSWHERLSHIATADRRFPPTADVLRLAESGRAIGSEPIGGGTKALGVVRRLASTLLDLLDEVTSTQGLRVDQDDT
ncbi:DUF6415 family natural product biosynthesis protein [Streptomyces cyaneofuscatus]|uniref:DUF6415 family natural product biosynthesis protein n=1 Tax=Streptomyces cyaneofuscatus TaxID=66883 RepID=UPI0033A8BD15